MEKVAFFSERPSGYGSGYGYGSGDGDGDGYGDGYGYGYGDGDGDGDGSGDGVKTINNEPIEYIDGIATILKHVKGNLARGFTVDLGDFSRTPCFVAKQGY